MRVLSLLFAAVCLISIGCSEKDDSLNPQEDIALRVTLGTMEDTVSVADLPVDTVDGEPAILLTEFVRAGFVPPFVDKNDSAHDTRPLYAYRVIGEDGFNAHDNRGYDDNIWAHFGLGYYLVTQDRIIFPDENIDLPSAFNVKSPRQIVMYRKIDVVHPAGDTTVFRELADFTIVRTTNLVGDPEDAVRLADIILADTLLSGLEGYQYVLASVDGYSPLAITWTQLQTGYWLLHTERTIFTAPELNLGKFMVQALEGIVVRQP